MKHTLIGILLLALTCITRAQAPPAPAHLPSFDVADIHRSPWVPPGTIYPDGGALHGDRYSLRQVTMVDLITIAYSLDDGNVFAGPPWLERARFDIFAKAPAATSAAALRFMLQSLLGRN